MVSYSTVALRAAHQEKVEQVLQAEQAWHMEQEAECRAEQQDLPQSPAVTAPAITGHIAGRGAGPTPQQLFDF